MFNKKHIQLSREELLELLIAEREKNKELERQLQEAKNELASREIKINNSGSIAEAALALSGIFEAADKACALYRENLEQLYKEHKDAADSQKPEQREKNIKIIKKQKVKTDPHIIKKRRSMKKLTHLQCIDSKDSAKRTRRINADSKTSEIHPCSKW